MAEAILEECEAEVPESGEDDRTCEEDLKAVEVEPVEPRRNPKQEVVEDGSDAGGSDYV